MSETGLCGTGGRSAAPEAGEVELDGVEGLGANRCVAAVGHDDPPAPAVQPVDLERLDPRIYQPQMMNPGVGVVPQIAPAAAQGLLAAPPRLAHR